MVTLGVISVEYEVGMEEKLFNAINVKDKKNRSIRILPCGTPEATGNGSEEW